ncbi:MAG TPA: UDP-2,3-diacylglucosamine diphosphatase [Gemmatimonadaceae bacterium]|nr:UDP-2,3-diacylglucosamine diphosphatase [Gemmatimonadaceae bacterium]
MSSGKPFLVVSDVHLGAVPPDTERAFRDFLRFAASEASGLLINGDLFDVWVASRHFVVRDHVRVLAAIADVVDAGVPVYFVGGNHDALEYGGPMLRDDLGVTLLQEPARIVAGRYHALVIHGDGVRARRSTYHKRHPILRSSVFRWWAQHLVTLDTIYEKVHKSSTTRELVARLARGEDTGPKPYAPLIEQWAADALRTLPDIDVVLAGHCHLPAHVEVMPGRYYVNTGDWISHMSYCVLPAEEGKPVLRRWPDRVRYITKPAMAATSGV